MKLKKLLLAACLSLTLLCLAGCAEQSKNGNEESNEKEEVTKVKKSIKSKENEFIEQVKYGTLYSYPNQEIGEAFDAFFGSPEWEYFEADTGEDVVEFSGNCTYRDQEVRATLQFIVEKDSDEFEVGALSFNDVPQDEWTTDALLVAVFEDEEGNGQDPDPNLAHNDSYFIEKAMEGYIDSLSTDTIGNIFNGSLFSNIKWSVDSEANVIINGDYNGEIYPGEGSNLEFTLADLGADLYTIIDLQFNGQTVPDDNYRAVLDVIRDATMYE